VKAISGKDFSRLLVRKGWVLARVNGSHHIFVMAARREHLSVPMHANQSLKPGLLRHFMKLADIEEHEL
jgi:predicted RNA binding protein YcfA (HicA-like mRNA interferase family)